MRLPGFEPGTSTLSEWHATWLRYSLIVFVQDFGDLPFYHEHSGKMGCHFSFIKLMMTRFELGETRSYCIKGSIILEYI